MKVYLAGPMRGIPQFNFPAFDFAASRLRELGFAVFSPAERDRVRYGDTLEINQSGDETAAAFSVGFSLREALAADMKYIAEEADAVAFLPGWEKSAGSVAEHALAKALGHTVIILGKDFVDGQ